MLARRLLAALLWFCNALALAAPVVLPPERGLQPEQLAVVVNEKDPLSERIGLMYLQLRGIPPANLVRVAFDPDRTTIDPGTFTVQKRRMEAQLPAGIQALALAWTSPYRVGCMSVTSAFAFGYDRAFCAEGCQWTRPSAYAGSISNRPFDDFAIRPAMMLAAADLQQAEALIRRGVAADRTLPKGGIYLVQTQDKARSTRAVMFPEAARRFGYRIPVQVLEADALRDRKDVMLYETGSVFVPDLASNQYLPGAAADHLTSSGGQLTDSHQMSALRWLEAGATGSYGTVVEPCAFTQKFPNPILFLDAYLRGETLLEAYWKSVLMPGQGVFIGEPLARPFAAYRSVQDKGQWWVTSPALTAGAYNVWAADSRKGPFQRVATGVEVSTFAPRLRLPGPVKNFYRLEPLMVLNEGFPPIPSALPAAATKDPTAAATKDPAAAATKDKEPVSKDRGRL
jgi:uncharacterized protein (TIGR03790 family)